MVADGVIDDLVQFGSPGSGVQDVSELHIPEGHMYVSAASYKDDMVQGLGPDSSFGKNPDKMEGYKHLSGNVGWFLPFPTIGFKHSSYFKEGTHANRDIARVIGGNPPS